MACYSMSSPHQLAFNTCNPLVSTMTHPPTALFAADQFLGYPQSTPTSTTLLDQTPLEVDTKPTAAPKEPAASQSSKNNKPKRKQVKNACVNCQKACKKCDDGRPCQRCIKLGLTATCTNSLRKERKKGAKRGPYRKRHPSAKEHFDEQTKQSLYSDSLGHGFHFNVSPIPSSHTPIQWKNTHHQKPQQQLQQQQQQNKGVPTWKQTCPIRSVPAQSSNKVSLTQTTSPYSFGAKACNEPLSVLTNTWPSNETITVLPTTCDGPNIQDALFADQDAAVFYLPTENSPFPPSYPNSSLPFSPESQHTPVSPDSLWSSSNSSFQSPVMPMHSLDQYGFIDTVIPYTQTEYTPQQLVQQPVVYSQAGANHSLLSSTVYAENTEWQYDFLSMPLLQASGMAVKKQ